MLFFFKTLIFVEGVFLWWIEIIAPKTPKIIKKIKKNNEIIFKKLKSRLLLIKLIIIFMLTKKYSGTNALKYNKSFFINIVCDILKKLI